MFAFLIATNKAQTLQANIDTLTEVRLILSIFFILSLLVGMLNLLFYILARNSPDLTFNFLIPRIKFKKKNISFEIEDDLCRPLGFTKLTVYKNEKIYKTYYSSRGKFSIFLPTGIYSSTVSKFGYTSSSTDNFKVDSKRLRFDLMLRRSTDIKAAPSIYKLAVFAVAFNALIAILSALSIWYLYLEIGPLLQIVLIALLVFSAYLAIKFRNLICAIELKNFKNRPLRHKDIEITDQNGGVIDNLTSDAKGRLKIMMTPGIYKFTPEDHSSRTIKVNEVGLGYLKIKF